MSTISTPLNVHAAHQLVLQLPSSQFVASQGLPVPNATKSFWMQNLDQDHTPSPTEGSEGILTNDADICIIGSGITGVSAAYHLSQAVATGWKHRAAKGPLKVLILDAREFCEALPKHAGRNGGHLTPHTFAHFTSLSKLFGASEAKRSLELERYTSSEVRRILNDTGKTEDVDFVSGGRVILLFTQEEEEATRIEFEAAKAAGIDVSEVHWLTKEEVLERYGASYPAVLMPGNNVWPLKLVSHLYNLAQAASPNCNLMLHTRTPVTSISRITDSIGSRKWALHTPRGDVNCSAVLHATNGYAAHLLPFMHGEVIPTRGQVITVRANTPLPFGTGKEGFVGNDGFEYWFPRRKAKQGDNELVVLGGGREAAKDGKFEFYEIDDSAVNTTVGQVIRDFLPAVFPGRFDKGSEPEMEWTGIMGFTRTGEPFVSAIATASPLSQEANIIELRWGPLSD
ncbi:FAD dependent oxidoreductase [Cytidiella melzeri]|nr:FAD dependent oxidoreductase [Cytidiella melzeri]